MAWRAAKSLSTLYDQVNKQWPKRSRASDGLIGDAAHAAVPSDHNPNADGVVTALDITNDPANGLNAHALADLLIRDRHPDLKYVISNRRIAGAWTDWQWWKYNGDNPHDKHIHVSVGVGDDGKSRQPYDDTVAWKITEEDEVTKLSIETLRIVHALVGGWDIEQALAGKYDKQFQDAAGWKDPNQFVYEQFVSHPEWRAKLVALQKGKTSAGDFEPINQTVYVKKP
jgi:hypothetical protein